MLFAVERYFQENIDSHTRIHAWDAMHAIPIYLQDMYNFYALNVLDTQCVLLEIVDNTPALGSIQKHLHSIQALTNLPIVLYYKTTTRYRRKSLLDHRIPFIIEDGQFFLPFLGLRLKMIDSIPAKGIQTFTPSAQIAYLYFLYTKDAVVNATELSNLLGWTVMTASRSLNALYDAKLLTYKVGGRTGRAKEYSRIAENEYFALGRGMLRSPIKRVVYVRNVPDNACVAGLEALAELSTLNPPGQKVRAIYGEEYGEIVTNADQIKDENLVELQVWEYDPKLFTQGHVVDPVSLYASFQEEQDERIEQALAELVRIKKWDMDS